MISRELFNAMHRKMSLSEASDSANSAGLRRTLTAMDLIFYGVGSAVGAGIYILAGIGAKLAGPAIAMSFLGCGLSCILTAFAYAEFSSLIPASGSAYIYTYVTFGEVYAFCVGWNLILGYGFTASVAARAWADYIGDFLVKITGAHWIIPFCTEVPLFGNSVNYTCSPFSIVIVAVSTIVLLRGAKDSSTFNNFICISNLSILALIVISAQATGSIEMENLSPFAPYGVPGILRGAGLVFYAFIGFDMVASLSEETMNPARNVPIGIVGSLLLSTFIYCSVTLAVVGMVPLPFLGETTPLVNAILANGCCTHAEQMEVVTKDSNLDVEVCLKDCQVFQKPILALISRIVSGGAGLGLMAACFTSLMGQPRIFYRMSVDGLWFPIFARINPKTKTMSEGILMTGFVAALIACFVPLEALANLISLGTLMVFTFVDAGVIILRLSSLEYTTNDRNTPEDKTEDVVIDTVKKKKRVVVLLIIYTFAILGTSFILSNNPRSSTFPLVLFSAVALICTFLICRTPTSWRRERQIGTVSLTSSQSPYSDAHFQCPLFPIIPLCGVAMNAILMGGLPVSSWLLCALWLSCGLSLYFMYGIHHSKIKEKNCFSQSLDTDRLLKQPTNYMSTE